MKRSILSRFIVSYLLFALLGFCTINFTTTRQTYEHLVKSQALTLYNGAKAISDNLSNSTYSHNKDLYNSAILNFNTSMDSLIWLVDTKGNTVHSTDDSNTPATIKNFDLSYFDDTYYKVGKFFNNFSSQVLTVYHPIFADDTTVGYVLIHISTAKILYSTIKIVDIFYLSYCIILFFSLILIMAFIMYIYIPLNALRRATLEYANGNFSYDKIPVNSYDEFGDLASSLNYMAHQLNDAEEYQKKFIANISHDFRSPLTSIKGYVEAIIDGTIPYHQQNKYLNIVLSEADRLERLTNELVNLNAWGDKKPGLIIEDFNICEVIKSILDTFEGRCEKKDITFKYVSEKEYMVNADKDKIQQVLYNLIDNAIKFSHNNGEISIKLYTKGDKLFCSIKDCGIGIPKKDVHKVWDRFYKTDASRGKDKTGYGIGLSIVKEIINAHGQNIDVISTEDVGTEFIFSLAKSKNKKGISL